MPGDTLTTERVAEPLPKWLADIESVLAASAEELHAPILTPLQRLLELAKAQREALDDAIYHPPTPNWRSEKWDCAQRLWEGK